MRDVVDQIRVIIAVHCTDPLVHARPLLWIGRCQLVALEGVIDIADNRARLIDRELAMAQDRYSFEGVQCDMAIRVHFHFEIVKSVRHLLMGQNDPGHLHIDTTREPEQCDIGHGLLHAAGKLGIRGGRSIPPQSRPGKRDDMQCLGGCLIKPGDCFEARCETDKSARSIVNPSFYERGLRVSWHRLEHPDGGRLRAGRPDRNKEPVKLGDKQPGSSARRGANVADALISAGIVLEYIDGARTTDDIDAMAPGIDKEIIGIAAGVEIGETDPSAFDSTSNRAGLRKAIKIRCAASSSVIGKFA